MTRIIAGSAGGRRLRTPPGSGTRPTSDRVREALFSSLESLLGSLERAARPRPVRRLRCASASRRCPAVRRTRCWSSATERAARAGRGPTPGALGLPGAEVRDRARSSAVLAGPGRTPYDLVFADPPYALAEAAVGRVLAALAQGWLADERWWSWSGPARSRGAAVAGGLRLERSRRYGETVLHAPALVRSAPTPAA